MGWEAADGSWTGGQPGRDHDLRWAAQLPAGPGPSGPGSAGAGRVSSGPAGFDHRGTWSTAAPSAALAFALETAAGPDDLYAGADTDALVGIVRQWAAVESWAAAGKLAALRAVAREDAEVPPGQAAARLDPHPAQARLARVDHPDRTHLHPGTMALHRLAAKSGAFAGGVRLY